MKHITLQTLRDWDACSAGYAKISEHVGENEVIDLNLALRVTSIPDVVWVLAHDPDKHRWLSFLADMIDFPGCGAVVQAVRDYRDGRVTPEDLRKIATDALTTATTRAPDGTRDNNNTARVTNAAYAAYAAVNDAANDAAGAVSASDDPRIDKLIRSYYQ